MATTNREIVYTLKMRNEARAALQAFGAAFRDTINQVKRSIQEIARVDPFRELGLSAQRARQQVNSATSGMKQDVNGLASSITQNVANSTNALGRLSTGATSTSTSVKAAIGSIVQSVTQANAALAKITVPTGRSGRTTGGSGAAGGGGSGGSGGSTPPGASNAAQNLAATATQAGKNIAASFAEARERILGVHDALSRLTTAFVAYMAVKEVLELTDAYTALHSQVKLVTNSVQEQEQTYQRLLSTANENRQGIDSAVNLYTRMARASSMLGIEQSKLMTVTDAVGKSMKLQAGNTQSMEAGVYQFTQAIASGQLRGDEFHSVMEQLPVLAQAIANGMHVNIATLREMSEQGRLTSDVIVEALLSQYGRLKAEAASMATTSAQAFLVLRNSLVDAVGRANAATGATSTFAQALLGLSDAVRSDQFQGALTSGMSAFGAALAGVTNIVKFAVEHFKLMELALASVAARYAAIPLLVTVFKNVWDVVKSAAIAVTTFVTTMASAGSVAARATTVFAGFRAVIGSLMGPWGIAITAASAAMYLLTSNTEEADKATSALAASVDRLRENYKRTGDATNFLNPDDRAAEVASLRERLATMRKQKNSIKDEIFGGPEPGSLMTTVKNAGGMMPWADDALSFEPIKKSYDKFMDAYLHGDGYTGVVKFREEITKIGVEARNAGNVGLADMTSKVLEATKATGDYAQSFKDVEERLAYFEGKMNLKERLNYEYKIGIRLTPVNPSDDDETIFRNEMMRKMKAIRTLNPDTHQAANVDKELADLQSAYQQSMNTLNAQYRTGTMLGDDYLKMERSITAEYKAAKDAISGLTPELRKLADARKQLAIDVMPDGRDKMISTIRQKYDVARREAQRNMTPDAYKDYVPQSRANEEAEIAAIDTRVNNLLLDRSRALRDELELSTLIGAQKERQAYWQQLYNEAIKGGKNEEGARRYADEGIKPYDQIKPQATLNQFKAGTLTDEIRSLREEGATLGMTTREKERYTAAYRIAEAARKAGIVNSQELVNEYLKEYDALQQVKESYNTFGQGFRSAMDEYLEETRNVANESKKLWSDVFGQLEDGLATFIKSGKFNFQSFLDSLASDIARFAARQLLSNLLGGWFSNMFGGGAGGGASTGIAGGGLFASLFGSKGPSTSTNALGVPAAAASTLPVTRSALANLDGTASLAPSGSLQTLLNARQAFSGELANQSVMDKLFARTEAETGGQGALSQTGMMESMFNRASARGWSLEKTIDQDAFFAKSSTANMNRYLADPQKMAALRAKYAGIYGDVRQGSNVSGFATDNGSLDPTTGRIPGLREAVASREINGETFMVARRDAGWARSMAGQQGLTGVQPGALTAPDPRISGALRQGNGLGFFQPNGAPNPMVDASKLATPQIQANMNSAFQNVASTTEGTFNGSFTSLGADFTKTMGDATQTVGAGFTSLFSGMSSGGGGGIFSFIGKLFGFHRGGIIGTSGSLSRSVSAAMFMGAPKFHSGGIIGGLSNGERAIIGKDGEAVMPTVRMPDGSFGVRAIGPAGGAGGSSVFNQTAINVSVNGGSSGNAQQDNEHAQNIAKQVDKVLDRKMAQWTQNQQRPGGIVPQKEYYA